MRYGVEGKNTPASASEKVAGVAEVAGVPVRRASSRANAPPCGVDRKTVAQFRSASLGNFPSEKRLSGTDFETTAGLTPLHFCVSPSPETKRQRLTHFLPSSCGLSFPHPSDTPPWRAGRNEYLTWQR
jgi:hypothetical protein